jgi:hypothetical protein
VASISDREEETAMTVCHLELFSKEVPESVALSITAHGGKVQTERMDPAHVFHRVNVFYASYRLIGGSVGVSPIYLYTLEDGARLIIQFIHAEGAVPGHLSSYWTELYIYTEKGDNGKDATTPTATR